MARQRIGSRRHVATIQQHNGSADSAGHPTYDTDGDWNDVICDWPCERLNVSGGERVRGRQTTSQTSHVFIGEYYGAKDTDTTAMRLVHDDTIFAITAAYDPDGDSREFRIEAKREQ